MTDELGQTLRELVSRLDALEIAYMLVGSVAALAYGRARSTQGFDMVIEADAATLRRLVRDGVLVSVSAGNDAAAVAGQRHPDDGHLER